jgi:hypothetical protein
MLRDAATSQGPWKSGGPFTFCRALVRSAHAAISAFVGILTMKVIVPVSNLLFGECVHKSYEPTVDHWSIMQQGSLRLCSGGARLQLCRELETFSETFRPCVRVYRSGQLEGHPRVCRFPLNWNYRNFHAGGAVDSRCKILASLHH